VRILAMPRKYCADDSNVIDGMLFVHFNLWALLQLYT
jgi:hypothetical protein